MWGATACEISGNLCSYSCHPPFAVLAAVPTSNASTPHAGIRSGHNSPPLTGGPWGTSGGGRCQAAFLQLPNTMPCAASLCMKRTCPLLPCSLAHEGRRGLELPGQHADHAHHAAGRVSLGWRFRGTAGVTCHADGYRLLKLVARCSPDFPLASPAAAAKSTTGRPAWPWRRLWGMRQQQLLRQPARCRRRTSLLWRHASCLAPGCPRVGRRPDPTPASRWKQHLQQPQPAARHRWAAAG